MPGKRPVYLSRSPAVSEPSRLRKNPGTDGSVHTTKRYTTDSRSAVRDTLESPRQPIEKEGACEGRFSSPLVGRRGDRRPAHTNRFVCPRVFPQPARAGAET